MLRALLGCVLAAALLVAPVAASARHAHKPAPHAAHAAAALPAQAPAPSTAPAKPSDALGDVETQATHAIIIDFNTGAVLLDKAADQQIPTASMSKMMTAYVVFTMLKDHEAKLTDTLPVSERAWRTGGSKMFVPLGQQVSIDDLIHGMIVQSGNDACVVLAEGLAGSVQGFVDKMNEIAKKIGLTHSHFANVDGLPDPDHYMSARDLATVAIRTIKDFPDFYKIYSDREFTFNKIRQGNRNPLLYKSLGADGLKTGHTEESGYSLTGSAVRNGRRVVMVLSGLPTAKARAEEGERLIEWAFRDFKDYKLFAAGDTVDRADVWLGAQATVPVTVTKDLVVTLPRKARNAMKVTIDYNHPMPAPVKKGEVAGKITVTAPDVPPVSEPLVAAADVPRMAPFAKIATLAGYLVWGGHH
jgi:D-alanyl-D-alanine carboxypeptidase (penicillin-binding protein 5/6)